MSLYHVQDSDRPLWVQADSYGEAVTKWKLVIAIENEMAADEVEEPCGVSFVCDAEDFIE